MYKENSIFAQTGKNIIFSLSIDRNIPAENVFLIFRSKTETRAFKPRSRIRFKFKEKIYVLRSARETGRVKKKGIDNICFTYIIGGEREYMTVLRREYGGKFQSKIATQHLDGRRSYGQEV